MIKGLSEKLRLPRRGKIRLGEKKLSKQGKEYPSALDFFACPKEIQEIYGDKPRKLDIMIPMEEREQFFPQAYKRYGSSAGLICRGNGEVATEIAEEGMKEIECQGKDCPHYQKGECKQIGNLQVILPKIKGLGVYQIDTSSYNSIVNINSGVEMIRGMLGRISWIPLILEVQMQEAHPQVNGKRIKTIIPVMSITSDVSVYDLLKMRLPAKQAVIDNKGVDDKPVLLFPKKDGSIGNIPIDEEQEKKAKATIDNIGETEVKDEPGLLSEEEAQKEQNKALGQKQEHDKEWQDKTRRTWHNLVKKMYAINYFADEPSYRAWMKQELNGKISYTKLTDAERIEGIGKMVGYANKYEQEKEK